MKFLRLGIMLIIASTLVFLFNRQWHGQEASSQVTQNVSEDVKSDGDKRLGQSKALQDTEKMVEPKLVWQKLENTQEIDYFKPNHKDISAISLTEQQEFFYPKIGDKFILPLPAYGDLEITVNNVYSSADRAKYWTATSSSHDSDISNVVATIGSETSFASMFTDKGAYEMHLVHGKGWVYRFSPIEASANDVSMTSKDTELLKSADMEQDSDVDN